MTQAQVIRKLKADLKRLAKIAKKIEDPEQDTEYWKKKYEASKKDINLTSKRYGHKVN